MGLRDEALDRFRTDEQWRVRNWQNNPEVGRPLFNAVRGATGGGGLPTSALESAAAAELDVTAEFQRASAVIRVGDGGEGDLELVVRMAGLDDGEPTGEVFPVGPCRGCGNRVPLGPDPSTSLAEIGEALTFGSPVGHDCRGRSEKT